MYIYLCVCMFVTVSVWIRVCTCVCKRFSGVFHTHSLLYFLRQGLSLDLEFIDLAELGIQAALRIYCFSPLLHPS